MPAPPLVALFPIEPRSPAYERLPAVTLKSSDPVPLGIQFAGVFALTGPPRFVKSNGS
jgi:hypothetical protein